MKKFTLGIIFSAIFAVVLHAGHPDAAHVTAASHDCALCQVVSFSDVPSIAVAAPVLAQAETIISDFVVFTDKSLSLLPDLRGPPAL